MKTIVEERAKKFHDISTNQTNRRNEQHEQQYKTEHR